MYKLIRISLLSYEQQKTNSEAFCEGSDAVY